MLDSYPSPLLYFLENVRARGQGVHASVLPSDELDKIQEKASSERLSSSTARHRAVHALQMTTNQIWHFKYETTFLPHKFSPRASKESYPKEIAEARDDLIVLKEDTIVDRVEASFLVSRPGDRIKVDRGDHILRAVSVAIDGLNDCFDSFTFDRDDQLFVSGYYLAQVTKILGAGTGHIVEMAEQLLETR